MSSLGRQLKLGQIFDWVNRYVSAWVWKTKLNSTGKSPSILIVGTSRKIYNPTLRPFLVFQWWPRQPSPHFSGCFSQDYETGLLWHLGLWEEACVQMLTCFPHFLVNFSWYGSSASTLTWCSFGVCLETTCTSRDIQVRHCMTVRFSKAVRTKNHMGTEHQQVNIFFLGHCSCCHSSPEFISHYVHFVGFCLIN